MKHINAVPCGEIRLGTFERGLEKRLVVDAIVRSRDGCTLGMGCNNVDATEDGDGGRAVDGSRILSLFSVASEECLSISFLN